MISSKLFEFFLVTLFFTIFILYLFNLDCFPIVLCFWWANLILILFNYGNYTLIVRNQKNITFMSICNTKGFLYWLNRLLGDVRLIMQVNWHQFRFWLQLRQAVCMSLNLYLEGSLKYIVDPEKIVGGGPPKDGIPSIDNPQFVSLDEADQWIEDNELVLAIIYKGVTRVYPLQIMVWHEIVNDTIAGDPLLITY